MSTSRDVWITIGKQNYSVETALEPDAVERVKSLISSVCVSPAKGINQEELLVLACLQLAYSLDKASESIEKLLGELG